MEAATTKGWDMFRYAFAVVLVGVMFLLSPQTVSAQASKRLEKKPVGASSQQNSWEQVDKINNEADGTRARHNQSRQSAGLNKRGYTGGKITASHVFPKTSKPKETAKNQKPVPKK